MLMLCDEITYIVKVKGATYKIRRGSAGIWVANLHMTEARLQAYRREPKNDISIEKDQALSIRMEVLTFRQGIHPVIWACRH